MRRMPNAWLPGLAAVLLACGGSDHAGPTAPPSDTTTTPPPAEIPITGAAVPGMESFDHIVTGLMRKYDMPGGAVAVVKDGRLVYARGFGYADVENEEPVEPDALFRIASLSKQITSATVLKLVEEGKLSLDDKAFALLPDLEPPTGATVDPRLSQITVRELLQHSGGWDRDKSFDPMFRPGIIASALGVPAPADAEAVVRYMMGQPLDFDPGTRYAYSNFGYDVLGRIIERVTGQRYADYVTANLLAPIGIHGIRQGRTLLADRAPGEVKYYAVAGKPLDYPMVQSVFPGQGQVPEAYGGFYLEAMDSHGAWISSTIDMLRFLTAVDGLPTRPDFLQPATIDTMVAHPPGANTTWLGQPYWYAMGWLVRPSQGDENWWHTGSLPGTTTLLVRAYNGLAWAAFFNARAQDDAGFTTELDQSMWNAVAGVTAWPTGDLFASFP